MAEQANSKGLNSDMITAIYRLAVVILLAGILLVQWQILGSMDGASAGASTAGPTYGDFRQAKTPEDRNAVIARTPLMRIQNTPIGVRGTVRLDSASVAGINR